MKKLLLFLLISPLISWTQLDSSKKYSINTVAFYNVENLFDTINDPKTFDDDRTLKLDGIFLILDHQLLDYVK